MLIVPFVLALATLALTACGTDDDTTPVTDPTLPTVAPTEPAPPISAPIDPLDLDGREFLSTEVEGFDLVDGTQIRLSFDGRSLGIHAGCNHIFGEFDIEGDRLVGGQFGTTEMACEPDLMAQDRWVTDVFALEPRLSLDGDTLTVRGVAGIVITFVDREVADPDRPLEGVRWVLDGIRTQDAVSSVALGVEASITFEDGRALVEAGCNTGSAEVQIGDDVITFGPLALTRMMCEPDAMEVEGYVTELLDGDVQYRIEANRLTLDSHDSAADPDRDEPAEMQGLGLMFLADEN